MRSYWKWILAQIVAKTRPIRTEGTSVGAMVLNVSTPIWPAKHEHVMRYREVGL